MHIGPHKTGTTAIQSGLHAARPVLPDHGVYLPRGGWRRRGAGWALGLPGQWSGHQRPPIGRWTTLVEEVAEARDARVCISNEDFGRADAVTAERIVRDLGDARVHVVAVARRLDRYLPSQWQERVKAGKVRSYEEWLRIVLGNDPARFEHRNVWAAHDLAALVDRWTGIVGPDRFTLVVFAEGDRTHLPHVFEGLLGLPAGTIRPSDRSNASLSYPEVELLRTYNRAARDQKWPPEVHRRFIREGVLPLLRRRPTRAPGPPSPPLPDWARAELVRRSDQRIADLTARNLHVVGDLEWLRVGDRPPPDATDYADLTVPVDLAAQLLEAAVTVGLKLAEQPTTVETPTPSRSGADSPE